MNVKCEVKLFCIFVEQYFCVNMHECGFALLQCFARREMEMIELVRFDTQDSLGF